MTEYASRPPEPSATGTGISSGVKRDFDGHLGHTLGLHTEVLDALRGRPDSHPNDSLSCRDSLDPTARCDPGRSAASDFQDLPLPQGNVRLP